MNTKLEDKIDYACKNYKEVNGNGKFLKLDEWLLKESETFKNEVSKNKNQYLKYKRGEIIKVDFGINIGTELSHTHYAIVINKDDTIHNDNITVIPITSKNGYKRVKLGKILKEAMPNTTKYNLNCYAIITQIKTISKKRIFERKFKFICDKNILNNIDSSIVR